MKRRICHRQRRRQRGLLLLLERPRLDCRPSSCFFVTGGGGGGLLLLLLLLQQPLLVPLLPPVPDGAGLPPEVLVRLDDAQGLVLPIPRIAVPFALFLVGGVPSAVHLYAPSEGDSPPDAPYAPPQPVEPGLCRGLLLLLRPPLLLALVLLLEEAVQLVGPPAGAADVKGEVVLHETKKEIIFFKKNNFSLVSPSPPAPS